MFIKRLEIQGFKTFADRTDLEFTSGITAVVGPNGSGKSNVADAVSWVLGEQNVRNLRANRAYDVIFAGSERRKSLGMAEVSLTIDNSCGSLPLDFSEVTITRRVFRSGEGEYLINKSPCRLRDIYELFLDTGMGREAYSTVSQGEIDAILSAKSEDRRSLIEEAAGIKKYRFRRKEAQKKLENTETNLRRVNDIISELSGQVEPLAEQAETAKRHDELTTRLREIETGLLINDLRRWSEELERARQAKIEGTERASEQDKRISDLEWEKEKLSDHLTEHDRLVEAARAKHQETTAAAQRVKSRLALIEERRRAAEDTCARLKSEVEQLGRRIEEARERLECLTAEESGAAEREARLIQDTASCSEAIEQLQAEIEAATRIVEDRKSAYIELAKEQAARRTEIESLRTRTAELEAAAGKYTAELESLSQNREEIVKKQEDFAARADELRAKEKARAEELPPLRAQREQAREIIASVTENLAEINRTTVGKASRLATLQEMAEAHEGFFEGVRSVMAARKNRKLGGNYAVVADVITVPRGYETAIEVALGSAVQDIITDSVDEAKQAIRFLKDNRAGRATFLPLNGVRPSVSGTLGSTNKPGVRGCASDIISYDKKYAPAINVLLGRVIVVDNIDNAVKLSRSAMGWGRIVTLDGEVIVPTGAMTGGIRPGKGPNLLGRKQEIDSLTRDLAELDAARAKLENDLASAKDSLADLDGKIAKLEQCSSEDRMALVEAERQLEFLAQERKRLEGQIEVVTLEKEDVESAFRSDFESLKALESQVSAAGQENIDLDGLVAGAEKRLEELTARRSSLSEQYMELSVTLASVRERRSGLQQSVRQTESAIQESVSELEAHQKEIEQQEVEIAVNARELEALSADGASGEETLGRAQEELDGLVTRRAELAQKAAEVDAELKSLHRARSETAELVRDCDVREARLEVQINQTSERLMEEYEVTSQEALAREEPVEVERGTASEVARLRREIRAMGPVNTGAIQEYERVSERWEFLTLQRNDLEAAREKLLDAIREIDESTRELFMTTFRAVGEHFEKMFLKLFGGGRTELVLTDPHNLLETGVEIIVQPPGKKLQNLLLLSGGERALTASALLFALLLVKPSPFVLFDEVDAPLDDANVERFAEVLREFSRDSQFIVITHNRATMEASDTLYGVAMQEPGVSKLISVRLTDDTERHKIGAEVVATA
ncbi:MAG: chromosome segregation protein SMC [Armatimonadetes bacterium]|nr:chromosome segregation protein SMC [Armatimonadota bacterium]